MERPRAALAGQFLPRAKRGEEKIALKALRLSNPSLVESDNFEVCVVCGGLMGGAGLV